MNDDEAHQADLEAYEQQARDALIASARRPLTADEISLLAWCAGIPQQEIRA